MDLTDAATRASPASTVLPAGIIAELASRYSEPHRHYHTLAHVESMLSLLAQHAHLLADPGAVEAAIWFHDAVYDPRAKGNDNETASAALAVERLEGLAGWAAERVRWVRELVLATATHELPATMVVSEPSGDEAPRPLPGRATDMALFLDMDLAILGAPEDEFDAYEAAVRREYAFVDDAAWRKGRRDVLLHLAGGGGSSGSNGPGIKGNAAAVFKTQWFREGEWGRRVQGNLERSLHRLDEA